MNVFFREFETDEDKLKLKQLCLDILNYVCDYKMTLRETSENLRIPLTTLHRYVHITIRLNFPTEYQRVCRILSWNNTNKFKPKKYWTICPY